MNDQSQIEAKIIHLTPPQRFQVAHQLPKDRPAVPNPVSLPPKSEEFKVITTNYSKIWAIRIMNGTWLLVTLFLKRCTRIDKNLLVVYVALVLLLLQVFMVISRAEAGPWHRSPLMTSPFNLNADRQHTRSAQTNPNHFISNAALPAQAIDRNPVTLAKNPPWQLRLASTCPGTRVKAAGPESFRERIGSFSAAGIQLGGLCPRPPDRTGRAMNGLEQSMLLTVPNRASSVSIPLSGIGVPQMITSIGF